MSLLNIWADKTSALVVVDTEAVVPPTGEIRPASKALYVAHLNCVIAGRGELALSFRLFDRIGVAPNFDVVLGSMESGLEYLAKESDGRAASCVPYLVGWSQHFGQMILCKFVCESSGKWVGEIVDGTMAPADGVVEMPARPALADVPEICRLQVERWRAARPDEAADPLMHVGGKLLAFEVSREETRVTTLGEL